MTRRWQLLLSTALVAVGGFTVWPGCVVAPLPPSRKPLSSLRKADYGFVGTTHPLRAEVVAKLGPPDEYVRDLRIACYELNKFHQQDVVLMFGVLPIGSGVMGDGTETLLIRYDAQDRAVQVEKNLIANFRIHSPKDLHWFLERWIKPQPK